jgi:cobalt/nickel transport system ATP-binding protein
MDTLKYREELQSLIGFLPQEFGMYESMSAWDFLNYQAILKGITDEKTRRERLEYVLTSVHMYEQRNSEIGSFSGGMKQRIGIALILLNLPRILVVDEPTAGLDPEGVDKVLNILNNLNEEGMSIVISSHDIEMVNHFADKIFVLYGGEIIAEGDKHQIFSDKELLKKAHLKAPVTTEILYKLKENGWDVDTEKISIDETVDEILNAKNS